MLEALFVSSKNKVRTNVSLSLMHFIRRKLKLLLSSELSSRFRHNAQDFRCNKVS